MNACGTAAVRRPVPSGRSDANVARSTAGTGSSPTEINVPFSQFYAAELQAAFERSGRPDETFFARCASVPGINAKYCARIGGNDAHTLARIEGARDIEDCAFSHPKIKSHYVLMSRVAGRKKETTPARPPEVRHLARDLATTATQSEIYVKDVWPLRVRL